MSQPKLFVASPLFNEPQKARIKTLIAIAEAKGFKVYNCERDGVIVKPNDDPTTLTEAFAQDEEELRQCDVILVNLDYHLPAGQSLCIVEKREAVPNAEDRQEILERHGWNDIRLRESLPRISPPIFLPDSGTVWEMAAAYILGKVVVTVQTLTTRVNLMLAQSGHIHLRDDQQVERVLEALASVQGNLCPQDSVVQELARQYPASRNVY